MVGWVISDILAVVTKGRDAKRKSKWELRRAEDERMEEGKRDLSTRRRRILQVGWSDGWTGVCSDRCMNFLQLVWRGFPVTAIALRKDPSTSSRPIHAVISASIIAASRLSLRRLLGSQCTILSMQEHQPLGALQVITRTGQRGPGSRLTANEIQATPKALCYDCYRTLSVIEKLTAKTCRVYRDAHR